MKVGLSKRARSPRLLLALALVLTGVTFVVQVVLPVQWQVHCRFHEWTGLPCPACGATRCAELLAGGHLAEAARMQPLLFGFAGLLVPFLLYLIPALLLNWPLPRVELEGRKDWVRLLAGIAVIVTANWIYLIIQQA